MAFRTRPVEYFNVSVKDRPGAAYELLATLAGQGINLLVRPSQFLQQRFAPVKRTRFRILRNSPALAFIHSTIPQ